MIMERPPRYLRMDRQSKTSWTESGQRLPQTEDSWQTRTEHAQSAFIV